MSARGGFTVIELLVVMAIMGLLLASFPFAINAFQESRAVDAAVQATAQALRRAQVLSQAVDGDATWGASVQTGSVTVFRGASYATRTTAYDEVLEFSDSVSVSGVTEVVFSKLAGEPNTIGDTTFETAVTTATLTINAKGAVSYE